MGFNSVFKGVKSVNLWYLSTRFCLWYQYETWVWIL